MFNYGANSTQGGYMGNAGAFLPQPQGLDPLLQGEAQDPALSTPMMKPFGDAQVNPIGRSPSFEIPGGQTPYRRGPYLPFSGEEKREEDEPFVPIPVEQAQGLPYGRPGEPLQGPTQGPATPVQMYGNTYMPFGPAGGGMRPTPVRQARVGVPAGFQNKTVS